ncbi:hypothetical protein PVAP13_6NG254848 [Panicum virgatum]|uniref:Aminotransferase-like plant mobile domain-containing protein n=1 Tax=Panicum virgatum TaxID=38727 RepID=A0A8T0R548_PANVG|nr:hypothetical protein PVAP13_6NG254848 [Panicum virgatum]
MAEGGDAAGSGSRQGGGEVATGKKEHGSLALVQGHIEVGSSRVSPGQIYRLVQSFSPRKRELVEAIGFGGMLNVPNLTKLNLKLSLWLLNQVDIESQAIVVGDNHMIRFFDGDVHKVFGIPCGPRKIDGRDAHVSQEAVAFMRESLGLVDRESHSLKRIESFLTKELTESSSQLEHECFQIAFVIYVMGHLLAPSVKHDYVSIDYWGALKCADHIVHYNWCEYVIRCVLEAASKVQSASPAKGTIQLPGCHLFLQVFYLDNIDVGPYNLPHNVFPRISVFDNDRMRVMIQRSVICGGVAESVCYQRRRVERSMSRGEALTPKCRTARRAYSTPAEQTAPASGDPDGCAHAGTSRFGSSTPQVADIGKFLNPGGLFEYLKIKYPNIIGSGVVNLLKRHNANCVRHYVEHQRQLIKENILLAEGLIEMIGQECIASSEKGQGINSSNLYYFWCNIAGHGESSMMDSMLHDNRHPSSDIRRKRDSFNSLGGDADRIKRFTSEGSVSVQSGKSRLLEDRSDMPSFDLGIDDDVEVEVTQVHRGEISSPLTVTPTGSAAAKRKLSPRSSNKNYSELLIGGMLMLEDDKGTSSEGKVLFGASTTTPLPRRKLAFGDFAPNPFYNGHVHRKPTPESILSLSIWVTGQYVTALARPWVTHPYPRHIEVTGFEIKRQFSGAEKMDTDMFALIVRRFAQLDGSMSTGNPELRWRHFLEPDFAAFALAGNDVSQLLSIQNQFRGDCVSYNLARTEMVNIYHFWVSFVFPI